MWLYFSLVFSCRNHQWHLDLDRISQRKRGELRQLPILHTWWTRLCSWSWVSLNQRNIVRRIRISGRNKILSYGTKQKFDVDSIFQILRTSSRQAQQTYRHLTVNTTICAIAILSVLYFLYDHIYVTQSHVTYPQTRVSNSVL